MWLHQFSWLLFHICHNCHFPCSSAVWWPSVEMEHGIFFASWSWLLIWYCLCSGMIACACDMSKWLVECECVCRQMDEWMVSGWNECDCVAWAPCNTGWKLNCYQLLWSISISVYTIIGMCERERDQRERGKREKMGTKSVWLEDCFRLQVDWPEWIERIQTTSNQQCTNQQHYT